MKLLNYLAALALAINLGGCSSSPSSSSTPGSTALATPKSAVPTGWSQVQSEDGKVSMSLPPNWIVADSKNPKFREALEDLSKNNPGLANVNTTAYYFMAIDTKPVNKFSNNLNIVKKPTNGQTFPFDEATKQLLQQELVKALPCDGKLNMEIVTLPQGSAYRYDATLKMKTSHGLLETFGIGYMLVKGSDLYIVTISTIPSNQDKFKPDAEQIMQTLSIK